MALKLDRYNPLATKVQTRDGLEAEILCVNVRSYSGETIAARVKEAGGIDSIRCYFPDGRFFNDMDDARDLINTPEPIHGWVNVYKGVDPVFYTNDIHPTKEEADRYGWHDRIACIEIKCKVGDGL